MGGEDAIKLAAETYLPKLSSQDIDEYQGYVKRSIFFNATGRTVDSFVGMIFRKDPDIICPDILDDFQNDITMQGQSFYDYTKALVREIISVGRSGTLIDWNEEEARPFAINYPAEQIINWQRARINGKVVLSMVVLQEKVNAAEAARLALLGQTAEDQTSETVPPQKLPILSLSPNYAPNAAAQMTDSKVDEYAPKMMDQIRVLRLCQEFGNDFVYCVEIWHKQEQPEQKSEKYVLVNTIYPQRKGAYLAEIPFVFHNPNNLLPTVDKSPMDDIIHLNLGHWKTTADLRTALHYLIPSPFLAGVPEKTIFHVGRAIICENENAKASYLEFKGEGVKPLRDDLDALEHQMAVLGARMLEREAARTETVDVLEMKQSGEQASLSQIAATLSESFTQILRWALWWLSSADFTLAQTQDKKTISVSLNDEFNPTDIQPQLVLAIIAANQAGILSDDSCVWALKKGELVNPLRDVQEELDLIATEAGNKIKNPTQKLPPTIPAA